MKYVIILFIGLTFITGKVFAENGTLKEQSLQIKKLEQYQKPVDTKNPEFELRKAQRDYNIKYLNEIVKN